MHRLISAMCWLILTSSLALVFTKTAIATQAQLQGAWTATKAERDGKPAEDVVGHKLTFAGNRFEIRGSDGKLLYSGSVRVNASTTPAGIDFEHKQGSLNGRAWKGIYAFEGGVLTIIDNAPDLKKARPATFQAGAGSGYVLITFARAKP
jgi:uncharacterized protein (TIGR03067 family)